MPISPKTKKIAITLGSSLLLAGGIFLLSASPTRAEGLFGIPTLSEMFYMALGLLANLIFTIAAWFVQIAATLLEFTFSIEKFTDVAVVKAGWQITRDICNIGFVLILLVLSFDSILQTGNYQIKTILPRLVIAALLINFSLVFCGIIIDFSQIITHFFYEAAVGNNAAGLSGQLAGALNIQSVYKETPGWGGEIKKAGTPTNIIIGIIFGTAILLIAAFTLAAAAVFFIVRMVNLWLLMILAPLAWVAMIVPNAPEIGSYWNKWWGEFLKWSFFAPVYMFFVYLAILIASTAPITSDSAAAAAQNNILIDNAVTGFFGNGIYAILQYITIVLLLIGGLKYAQKSGIVGAKTIIDWGKQARDWSKNKSLDWTKIRAQRALYGTAGGVNTLSSKFLDTTGLSKTKFFGKATGRQRATAQQYRKENLERAKNTISEKAYGKLLGSMQESDVFRQIDKERGVRRLMAAEEANKRGLLTKATCDTATAKSALETFKKDPISYKTDIDTLKQLRPDILLDDKKDQSNVIKELKEAIKDGIVSGSFNKIKGNVLAGEAGKQIMGTVQEMIMEKRISQDDFNRAFTSWYKETKDPAEKAMKANPSWSNNFDDSKNFAAREMFAGATGKIQEAFEHTQTKLANPAATEKYVQSLNAKQIGSIPVADNEESLRLVGEHVKATQLSSIRNELNGTQKLLIIEGVQRSDNQVAKEFVSRSDAWAKSLGKMGRTMERVESTLRNTGREQTEILKSQNQKLGKISNQPNEK